MSRENRLEAIKDTLLAVADKPPRTEVILSTDDITFVMQEAIEIFKKCKPLVRCEAPITICGDTHGQYSDLLRILEIGGMPPKTNYLFLGDYVDRAEQSVEVVCLMFTFKCLYPDNFHILRGNHECSSINRIYGFYDECKRRYNGKIWRTICDAFNWLPVAAVVSDRIFCCHGGLSPYLATRLKVCHKLQHRIQVRIDSASGSWSD